MNRILIAGASLALANGMAQAAEIPEGWHQADVAYEGTRIMSAGGNSMSSKFHYAPPGKHRQEMEQSGMSIVTIVREDKGVIWSLLGGGMYIEMAFGEQSEDGDPLKNPQGVTLPEGTEVLEFEELGEETVNGFDTTKYRVVMVSDGQEAEGLYWMTEEQIPVRMEVTPRDGSVETVVIEMTELSIQPQADTLFELPPGATELATGNLGALFGGGAAGGQAADGSQEPGLSQEITEGVQESAEDATKEEVNRGVKDAVKKGLKGLFGG